jgi:predicted RNase H-like nuclease (RuvC/YqgF family)
MIDEYTLEEKILILETKLENTNKTLDIFQEENNNLKLIIERIKGEKLELQKQLADTQHQLNVLEYKYIRKN